MAARTRDWLAVGLVLVAVLGTSACSKSKSTAPITNSACVQKAQQAKTALENALFDLINSPDPNRPSDIDLQPVYQLYQDAIACDATNADANLGLAVTGLVTLSSDTEVNAAFDEWKTYLATHTPFEVPSSRLAPLGVPITFMRTREALHLPFELVPLSAVAMARPTVIATDPQISRIQDILETRVLPKLSQARASLAVAAANPSYKFIVTPRMQGDEGASPVEIDRTDILALRSAVSLLEAACDVAVSYQLGVASYDSAGLYQAFQPGGGWMALRAGGASHMANAGTSTLGALDDLDGAIGSLLAETDPQDDDVIKIAPGAFSRADVESLRVYLPQVRQAILTGYTRVDDWDGRAVTPDVSLTIRPGQLFSNAVPDWKALFPAYTQSVIRRPARTDFRGQGGTSNADVDVPADAYYNSSYSLTVQNGQEYPYYNGDQSLWPALAQVLHDQLTAVEAQPGWAGYFFGTSSFYGTLTSGPQAVPIQYQYYYTLAASYVFVPVITWQADTFDAWTWPDPTLHGVLPQMTSSSQLLDTFGITANQWSKQVVLEWKAGPTAARVKRPLP